MPLKLERKVLERIVHEELAKFIAENLNEALPGRGTALDDVPDPEQAPEEQLPNSSPADEPVDVDEPEAPEIEAGEEPADDELEDDLAGSSGSEPGSLAAELEGKTIESISLDDDSKIMPGATEVVVTFRENPDALRLMVTKTGKLKIFYRGLHNDFSSPVEQIPGSEEEEDLGAEEMPGAPEDAIDASSEVPPEGPEELDDVPPLGDDDLAGPPEEELPPKKQ